MNQTRSDSQVVRLEGLRCGSYEASYLSERHAQISHRLTATTVGDQPTLSNWGLPHTRSRRLLGYLERSYRKKFTIRRNLWLLSEWIKRNSTLTDNIILLTETDPEPWNWADKTVGLPIMRWIGWTCAHTSISTIRFVIGYVSCSLSIHNEDLCTGFVETGWFWVRFL